MLPWGDMTNYFNKKQLCWRCIVLFLLLSNIYRYLNNKGLTKRSGMSSVRVHHGVSDTAIFALFIFSHSELQWFPEVNYFFRTNNFSGNFWLNQMLISINIKTSHWTFISSQTNSICILSPRTFEIHFVIILQYVQGLPTRLFF